MTTWCKAGEEKGMRRRLTVPLDEDEWRRFVELHPDPVGWIVRQIRRSIRAEKAPSDR